MDKGADIEIWYHQVDDHVTPSSIKECNYGMRANQTSLTLTKFIVNSINIYVFN